MLSRTLAAIAALVVVGTTRADVRLHPIFTDHMVLQRDVPLPIWGTARPGEAVTVAIQGNQVKSSSDKVVADAHGKWFTGLPKMAAGGPFTLTVTGPNNTLEVRDILVGEVWVCSGQSNMEWPLYKNFEAKTAIDAANYPNIRLLTVQKNTSGEPLAGFRGEWKLCEPASAKDFSAVGYFFGRDLQKALNVPVGLIHTSWGGTPAQAWTSREKLASVDVLKYYVDDYDKDAANFDGEKARAKFEEDTAKFKERVAKAKEDGKDAKSAGKAPQRQQPPSKSPGKAATLYNGMIAPLLPFPIAGATWYQGESNNGKAYEYRTLLPAMIDDWRAKWGCGDFPFLVVQLAPYWNTDAMGQTYAELREAQLLTAQKTPKVGLAVITDVGDEKDIHPTKKEPVGQRLALLAREIAYGEHIIAMGPVYKSMTVEGNKAVLSFANVGAGLECRGEKLIGFEMCGDDRKFHPAEAVIRGDSVVVSCEMVEKPEAVRFGFRNYVAGLNLWNKDGLPATPFRTDKYPGVTEKKK